MSKKTLCYLLHMDKNTILIKLKSAVSKDIADGKLFLADIISDKNDGRILKDILANPAIDLKLNKEELEKLRQILPQHHYYKDSLDRRIGPAESKDPVETFAEDVKRAEKMLKG